MKLHSDLFKLLNQPNEFKRETIICAHRGGAEGTPENTMAAFQNALHLKAEAIEIDIHLSADGQIVICHDETLERTTNGQGFIRSTKWSEMKNLDAGSYYAPEFKNEPLPLLDDYLDLINGKAIPVIEIKYSKVYSQELEAQLFNSLKKNNLLTKCILQSFDPAILTRLAQWDPLPYIGYLTIKPMNSLPKGIPGYHPGFDILTEKSIADFKKDNKWIAVWTVNEKDQMQKCLDWGIDIMITDYPSRIPKT